MYDSHYPMIDLLLMLEVHNKLTNTYIRTSYYYMQLYFHHLVYINNKIFTNAINTKTYNISITRCIKSMTI